MSNDISLLFSTKNLRREEVVDKSKRRRSPTCQKRELLTSRSSREPPIMREGLTLYPVTNKKHTRIGVFFVGAEKRIRTSGPVFPVTRFPIVLLKPLRHLCKYFSSVLLNAYLYYCIFQKNASVFILVYKK